MNSNVTKLKTGRSVHQVRVTLLHCDPPIWRCLLVDTDMPLKQFHDALQISMGWQDCHLHQFIAGDVRYGIPDADLDPKMKSEAGVKLKVLLPKAGAEVIYEYDFGDAWEHELLLEEILPWPDEALLPRCVAGERACPPEDCGGPPGYADLLAGLNDPAHPEPEAMREWLGDDFDPDAFDVSAVNFRLGRIFVR